MQLIHLRASGMFPAYCSLRPTGQCIMLMRFIWRPSLPPPCSLNPGVSIPLPPITRGIIIVRPKMAENQCQWTLVYPVRRTRSRGQWTLIPVPTGYTLHLDVTYGYKKQTHGTRAIDPSLGFRRGSGRLSLGLTSMSFVI